MANALRFAGELVKGKVFEVAKEEFKKAKRAGLDDILAEIREANKPKESGEEVKEPPKEVVTAALFGIEVTDLDDAVRCLWKLGIYAESGMGCTGPIIRVSEANLEKSEAELKAKGYIS